MATLETQYKNYMEKNPLSEFTFEQWKDWWGKQLADAIQRFNVKQTRESLVKKINTSSDFEVSKDEMMYIVENWLSIHSQHKLNYIQMSCEASANVSINKDTIFKQ